MRIAVAGLLVVGLLPGQSFVNLFDKAPPHIEQALRDRITFFYQCHVEGKFRQADQAVHEDTKDLFFGLEKRQFKAWRMVSIAYEENYTRAKVVIEVDDEFLFVPGGRIPVKRPLASQWKYEGGQWWFHVPPYKPEEGRESPFGIQRETKGGDGQANIEAALINAPQLMEEIRSSVKATKTAVELDSVAPSSDTITLTNTFQGQVKLGLHVPEMAGLAIQLDKTAIEPGEAAKLTISYKPALAEWKPDIAARVEIQPTAQVVNVRISFRIPPKDGTAPKP